jgi:hypothetical protein
LYLQSSKQSGKGLKAVSLGTTQPPPSKPTKENLLHSKQGKGSKIKKRSRLELAKAHTKQTHKGKSIALAKPPPSKGTKEIYCTCKQGKTSKIKKRSRLELAKAHTKQKHKGKSIVLQIGKGSKDKEAVTLFRF